MKNINAIDSCATSMIGLGFSYYLQVTGLLSANNSVDDICVRYVVLVV